MAFSVFRSKIVTLFDAAIAHEPAIELGNHRNTVNARCIGNIADHLAGVDIDDDDVGGVRDVEAAAAALSTVR